MICKTTYAYVHTLLLQVVIHLFTQFSILQYWSIDKYNIT